VDLIHCDWCTSSLEIPFEEFDQNEFNRIHITLNAISTWHCKQSPPCLFATTTDLFREPMEMDLYLKFHLDYFLFVVRHSESDERKRRAASALRGVLSQIIKLVPRCLTSPNLIVEVIDGSHIWPWVTGGFWIEVEHVNSLPFAACKVAFIYGLAVVLWEAMGGPSDTIYSRNKTPISSGQLLCRLFALQLSQSQPRWLFRSAAQYLLWAGIGLRKEEQDGMLSNFSLS